MDNASYHSAQTEKIPNTSSNKEEIKEFLQNNDLFFEESYTKKQLLEVLKTRQFTKKYNVDDMTKKRGFQVLRLPPYHCNFNPIEMIWAELKSHLRRNNTSPKFGFATIQLIKDEIGKISNVS
ncbi:DDE 3 domain containing protein [Asbolus verrucosus]|uniref:DDE 3 domain containing protein n=1 Tax=Asbolus verrucosus TaxID=1661398 RepID=A0A482VGS1_ASBVE|nr:DDE 3 domain containing protein [Asbolus verrucosus]